MGRSEEPEHPENGPGAENTPETPPETTRKTQTILVQIILSTAKLPQPPNRILVPDELTEIRMFRGGLHQAAMNVFRHIRVLVNPATIKLVNGAEKLGHWRQRNGVVDSVTVRQCGGDQRKDLAPVFAQPGASPRSRSFLRSRDRPRCRARVTGMISPALASKRLSSMAIHMWTGLFGGSI